MECFEGGFLNLQALKSKTHCRIPFGLIFHPGHKSGLSSGRNLGNGPGMNVGLTYHVPLERNVVMMQFPRTCYHPPLKMGGGNDAITTFP